MKSGSRIRLFVTPWTVACQAPPSMGFSRQEYWSGVPFPSPGDLPNPGMEPGSPALQAGSLLSELPGKPYFQFMRIHLKSPLPSLLILSFFSVPFHLDISLSQPSANKIFFFDISISLSQPSANKIFFFLKNSPSYNCHSSGERQLC